DGVPDDWPARFDSCESEPRQRDRDTVFRPESSQERIEYLLSHRRESDTGTQGQGTNSHRDREAVAGAGRDGWRFGECGSHFAGIREGSEEKFACKVATAF